MADKPETAKSQPTKPPHPFTNICKANLDITVQQKGGTIVRGRAKWHRNGFLKVEPATIIGRNQTVEVPWVLIENQAIAHVHPAVAVPDQKADE